MFGYLVPQTGEFTKEENTVWQKSQCGICMSFKKYAKSAKLCQCPDFVFLNVFLHEYLGKTSKSAKKFCFFGGIKSVEFYLLDEISDLIAQCGVLLSYLMPASKYYDNGKRKVDVIKPADLRRAFEKCSNLNPSLTQKLEEQFILLQKMQSEKETDLDKISNPAGNMLKIVVGNIIKKQPEKNVEELFFHVGKWCYLMGLIDSIKLDYKNKVFNPLLASRNFQGNKLQFVVMNKHIIEPVLRKTLNNIKKRLDLLKMETNIGIYENVLIQSPQAFLDRLFKN